jgi:hypothetical protein
MNASETQFYIVLSAIVVEYIKRTHHEWF